MTNIVHLIDASGSIPVAILESIRARIAIGDRVIMFDTEPHGDAVMATQEQIDTFQFWGGGGTMINSTLALVERTDPDARIYCYTDGYFVDGDEYKSKAIQNSSFFQKGNFKLILVGRDGSKF